MEQTQPFQNRRGRKRRHSDHFTNQVADNTEYNTKAVKVLDNIVVPLEVLRTMALGQSFKHPKLNQMDGSIKAELFKISLIEKSLSDNAAEKVICDFIKSVRHDGNKTAYQKQRVAKIAQDLFATKKYLKDNADKIITTADKGNIAIISKRATFIGYRTEHLNANLENGTYKIIADSDRNRIKEDNEEFFSNVVKEIAKNMGIIKAATTDEVMQKIGYPLSVQDTVFVPGRLFGKLKIHKDTIGYRPIVDISVRLGGPLEECVQHILSGILDRNGTYIIKSTTDLVGKLKRKFGNGLTIPHGHVMMKLDFNNMFTNVPIKKALEVITRLWNDYMTAEQSVPFSGEIASKVIEYFVREGRAFFTSDDVLYKQERGLVMGAPLSAIVALILLNDTILQVKVPENTFIAVYVDDVLFIANPYHIGRVAQNFEYYLPEMPFSLVKESYIRPVRNPTFTLRYLEVSLYRYTDTNLLSLKWDYESYHSRGTLNFHSHDSLETKKGILIGMLIKAITFTTKKILMEEALTMWKEILLTNEYPIAFIITLGSNYINRMLSEKDVRGTTPRNVIIWGQKFMNRHQGKQFKTYIRKTNTSIYRPVQGYGNADRLHDHTAESNIFTKIKDILPAEYVFHRIVTWQCDVHNCKATFIAKIQRSCLKDTVNEIVQNSSSTYCKHMAERHTGSKPAAYPKNIRFLNGFNKTSDLYSLMQIEVAANPQLIVANTDETFTHNSIFVEAITQIKDVMRSTQSYAARSDEGSNIAGPSH